MPHQFGTELFQRGQRWHALYNDENPVIPQRMNEIPGYDRLSEALLRLGFTQDAAEYHGTLCGALCVKTPGEIDPLRLLESAETPEGEDENEARTLRELCGHALDTFNSVEFIFSPLLPDDEEDLTLRVRALSSWCEGFLYGLSTGAPLDLKQCSPEFKEIVRDFTEFTHAGVDEGDETELEETAYAELVEYIRVGAQLIYMELRGHDDNVQQKPTDSTLH